jgi:hypothetical protein
MGKLIFILNLALNARVKQKHRSLYNYGNNSFFGKRFSSGTGSKIKPKTIKKDNPNMTKGDNVDLKKDLKSSKDENIFIFSHETGRRYYKLNVAFLGLYSLMNLNILKDKDYPDYLRKSMVIFLSLTAGALIVIGLFASRHVESIHLKKPANILLINTFSKFGFSTKNYQLPVKDIKEVIPLSRYIRTKNTGLYLIKPTPNHKYFKFLNFFIIRPQKTNNIHFDEIFSSKLIHK